MWLWGAALDRIGTGRLIPWFQLPMAAGFMLIGATETPLAAAVGLALMAMTTGGNSTLVASFWAEFYGTRYLGAIKATAAAVMVLATALGPGLTGLLIDAGITFDRQLFGIGCWFLLSAAIAAVAVGKARLAMIPR
jgi:MFS family permease